MFFSWKGRVETPLLKNYDKIIFGIDAHSTHTATKPTNPSLPGVLPVQLPNLQCPI